MCHKEGGAHLFCIMVCRVSEKTGSPILFHAKYSNILFSGCVVVSSALQWLAYMVAHV